MLFIKCIFVTLTLHFATYFLLFQSQEEESSTIDTLNKNIAELRDWKFRINVFGWRRKQSLDRLLKSLLAAEYSGYNINLHFWIDGEPNSEVVNLVDNFDWPHGEVIRHYRKEHFGLAKNLGSSWNGEGDELCFFFEDDVEVSPYFFRWTLKVLSVHNTTDPNLIGISLAGLRLNQNTARMHQRRLVKKKFVDPIIDIGIEGVKIDQWGWNTYGPLIDYRLHNGSDLVVMQVASSWGSLYFPKPWRDFYSYFNARINMSEEDGKLFAIPNSNTAFWRRSWKLFLNEMMVSRSQYMIYPNLHNQTSFCTTHREKGEHTSRRGKAEIVVDELTEEKNWLFTVPIDQTGEYYRSIKITRFPSMMDHYHLPTTPLDLKLQSCAYLRKLVGSLGMSISYPNGRQQIEFFGSKRRIMEMLFEPSLVLWCEYHYQERARFEPEITIFTTLAKPKEDEKLLVENTLSSYSFRWPEIQTLVFSSKEDCEYFQGVLLVDCIALPDKCVHPQFNLPYLDCIFQSATLQAHTDTIVYINADITITTRLSSLVSNVKKTFKHYLIIGQRLDYHNVVAQRWNFEDPEWDQKLRSTVLRNSTLHPGWGMDYFVMDRQNPIIEVIPPFLVGCIRWDNWMVKFALLHSNIVVIDATMDIFALHVKDPKQNYYQSRFKPGNKINIPLAGYDYRVGLISNAPFRLESGKVVKQALAPNARELIAKHEHNWKLQLEAERVSNWTRQFHSRKRAEEFLKQMKDYPFNSSVAESA